MLGGYSDSTFLTSTSSFIPVHIVLPLCSKKLGLHKEKNGVNQRRLNLSDRCLKSETASHTHNKQDDDNDDDEDNGCLNFIANGILFIQMTSLYSKNEQIMISWLLSSNLNICNDSPSCHKIWLTMVSFNWRLFEADKLFEDELNLRAYEGSNEFFPLALWY